MAKIHSMMDIGKRSMMNSQTALQTVAHNIANKSTEGYSRQNVDLQTAVPVTEGRYQIGMGARAASISRTNNPFLDKQLQNETGNMGYSNSRADALAGVEQIFNEQANKGLNQYVTDFFNSFRELSNYPESATSRSMVKEAGVALVRDFQRVNNQLDAAQKNVNEAFKTQVTEVNGMVAEVAQLNEKISQVEISGAPANDQRDRRDVLLKKINEKLDIKWAEGKNGIVTVSTAGNGILVSGYDSAKLRVGENAEGRTELFFVSPQAGIEVPITDRIKSGEIGGSLSVRDGVIDGLKEKVTDLALTLTAAVNAAHRVGVDRNGAPAEDFFIFNDKAGGPSIESLDINEKIQRDVNYIAAGTTPGAVGDNAVANVISQLQNKELMDGGNATLDDFYNSQVGSVGVLASRAVKGKESQENVLKQLNNMRESISGVSLDEETTKMIEFQKAFEASARVIKTADEMFDTVLNLKRM